MSMKVIIDRVEFEGEKRSEEPDTMAQILNRIKGISLILFLHLIILDYFMLYHTTTSTTTTWLFGGQLQRDTAAMAQGSDWTEIWTDLILLFCDDLTDPLHIFFTFAYMKFWTP